jgi:hypothetical protein
VGEHASAGPHRLHGDRFRLAARNLNTWTDYSGVDPETNLEGSFGIGRGQDYFNNPQTRSLIFSINLTH